MEKVSPNDLVQNQYIYSLFCDDIPNFITLNYFVICLK